LLLAAGQVAGQTIGFAVLIVVAHRIGPAGLGVYQFATSVGTYFLLVSNLGLTTLAVRDVASGGRSAREVTGEVLILRLTLAIALFACLLLLAPLIAPSHQTRIVLDIVGVMLIVDALTFSWVLQARERLGILALATLGGQVVYGALTPFLVTSGFKGVESYTWLNMLGLTVTALLTAYVTLRHVGMPVMRRSVHQIVLRFKRSVPFAWSFVMIQIYYTSDFIILGYLRGTHSVGEYSVAYRLPQAVIAIAGLWVTALYPYLARRSTADRAVLRQDTGRAASFALVIGFPLIAGTVILAHSLLRSVFGDAFAPAATAFTLLMANAAVIIVSVNFGYVLLAIGDERRYAIGVSVGAVVNIGLNVLLIPSWGPAGAALATLGAELIVLAYMVQRSSAVLGRLSLEWTRVGRGFVAALLMMALIAAINNSLPAPATVVVGAVGFLAAAVALRAVTIDELALWRRVS
jgi:O-antigen/teichoic acid export membrane protein